MSPDATVVRVNAAWEGLGIGSETGRNIHDFFGKDHRVAIAIDECLRLGNCYQGLLWTNPILPDVCWSVDIDPIPFGTGSGVIVAVGMVKGAARVGGAKSDSRESHDLLKAEETVRLAQALGGVGVWGWDPSSGRLSLEPEFEGLYGCAPGTMRTYDEWARRLVPEDLKVLEKLRGEALCARRPFECEFRYIHSSGGERWMATRGSGVYDEDGALLRVIGVNVDITSRKHVEEALRENEEKLRVALQSARLGIFDYNVVNGSWDCDDSTRSLLGVSESHRDVAILLQLVHPDDRGNVKESLTRALDPAGTGFLEVEYRIRRGKGGYAWNLAKGQTYFREDAGGRYPVRLIGVNIDISELRRAEAAAALSEEKFRTLADNIAQLAWMAGGDGSIFWYNKRWFDYTGTSAEDMQGCGCRKVLDPEHLERVEEKFRRHLELGEEWEDTFPIRGRDGCYRWFLSRAVPIRNSDGKITRWFGTNTDITKQLEAEAALQESHRMKDDYLAMLSHELRNPLAPIENSLFILNNAQPGSLEDLTARNVITRQTRHFRRLVDDLLDITRLNNGKIDLKLGVVDLFAAVRHTAHDYASIFAERGVTFDINIPDAKVMAHIDPHSASCGATCCPTPQNTPCPAAAYR